MFLIHALQGVEDRTACLVFQNPLFGECAVLNLRQDLYHFFPDEFVNYPWPAGEVAVFGGIAHGVAHIAQAALINQVNNELKLVQDFKVGYFRLVAGLNQCLKTGLYQRGYPTTQHRLLTEQVSLGLLGEGSFYHSGTAAADTPGVGKGYVPGLP